MLASEKKHIIMRHKKNYFKFGLIFFLAFSFLNEPSFAQNEQFVSSSDQIKILNEITEELKAVKNLKANFTQERHLSILVNPLISEGYCFFEKPDKLRWEIFQPYQSILIYNKNQIAKFDIIEKKLRKLKLGTEDLMREILKQIISWMKGDFTQAQEVYNLKIYKSGVYRLELIPKSEELQKSIKSIELIFKANLKHISSVQINEAANDFIKINFNNEENNLTIEPAVFDLKNPQIINRPSN